MKAARLYGPRDVRVEDIEEPEPGLGEVKIKVAWNALSTNDVQSFLSPTVRFKAWPAPLGHEFSGTIVALGKGVDANEWHVGNNVVVEPLVSCMITTRCHACASGHRNRCPKINFIGKSAERKGGGLAEYVAIDTQHVHKLPDNISLEVAACIDPLAIAWHAVKRAGFREGDTALILGGGPVSLFILRVLRSMAPTSFILVSEASAPLRSLALKHGASDVLNPLHTDFGASGIIHKATAGFGVHAVFDTIGAQVTVDAALLSLRTGGTLVNMVVWKRNATMNMNFLFKEITVTGAMAYNNIHPEVIEALAEGRIQGIEELITDKIQIEDVVQKGFLRLMSHGDEHVKILVRPFEPPTEPSTTDEDFEDEKETSGSQEEQGTTQTQSAHDEPVIKDGRNGISDVKVHDRIDATSTYEPLGKYQARPRKLSTRSRFIEVVD